MSLSSVLLDDCSYARAVGYGSDKLRLIIGSQIERAASWVGVNDDRMRKLWI